MVKHTRWFSMGIAKTRCTWGREELTSFSSKAKVSMFIRNRRQILLLHQLILSELAFIPPEIIRPYVFSWFQGELKLICLILEKKFGDVPLFSRLWKRTSYEIFCQLKVGTTENSYLVPVFQKTFLQNLILLKTKSGIYCKQTKSNFYHTIN